MEAWCAMARIDSTGRARRRGALVVAALVAAGAITPTAAPAAGCATEAAAPDAVLCLVNAQRAGRKVGPLRADTRLTRVAQRFADRLGPGGPLTHQLEGGPSPQARIAASGYGGRTRAFDFSEILGRSFGDAAPPDQRVRAWMDDTQIRRALLARRFRDLGVGASTSGDTTTYVVVIAVALKPRAPKR
jgi:uncharacterized protein YkwD